MKTSSPWTRTVVLLSCLGLLLPQPAMAAAPTSPLSAVKTTDAMLGPEGKLQGTLVDPQGIAVSNARVIVLQGPNRIADTTTDQHGQFTVGQLRPGTYLVAAAGTVKSLRVWTRDTAPPAATPGVLMVSNEAAMRAQRDWYQWISENYILFCCAIAAAIAVPVCVIEANRDDEPVSP